MVGIVIVSHSYRLAEGVKELADSLTGGRVLIATAGGLDENTLGTSVERIMKAVQAVWQGDGILIFVDLGSSVLNTKLALELLPSEIAQKIVLSTAPLVEATLTAALQIDAGGILAQVVEAAEQAVVFPKGEETAPPPPKPEKSEKADRVEGIVTVINPDGIHARSAARIVEAVKRCQADVFISKMGANSAPVKANSLLSLLSLSGKQGDQLLITAEGEKAQAALKLVSNLFISGFN